MPICDGVVILENHPLVMLAMQEQIKTALPEAKVMYVGDNLSDALTAIAYGARLVVMDHDLGPDVNASAAIAQCIAAGANIVVTSAHDRVPHLDELCRNGVLAFIPKRLLAVQLSEVAQHIEKGMRWLSPQFASALAHCLAESENLHEDLALYAGGVSLESIARRDGISTDEVWQHLLDHALGKLSN